ncbi:MAG: hypothetical protein IJU52_01000 [Clostridia bacterium]|nr:hypothetical protein [Clostridia bacterium]
MMRTLTIERRKSLIACLGKMKVYIEDEAGDLVIDGRNTRLLGLLRNGETASFEIPEGEKKIYIIADKISKKYCVEQYALPAEGDVSLSGQNCFDPAAGNAFRIDGNLAPNAVGSRKKSTRYGMIALIISVLIGIAVGVAVGTAINAARRNSPKEFTVMELTVTLRGNFKDCSDRYGNATAAYANKETEIVFARQDKSLLEMDLNAYTVFVKNSLAEHFAIKDESAGDLHFFEYVTDADGKSVCSVCACYEGKSAFWFVLCTCDADNASAREAAIGYLQTVRIAD